MNSTLKLIPIMMAGAAMASCASMATAQQSLTVETAEPGAAVYLEVEGVAVNEVRVPGIVSGTLSERAFVRDFGYIGTTPLTYSIPTYGETRRVSLPGRFRTGEERYARTGFVRVEHANGYVEERQFTIRNGGLTLIFPGAPEDKPADLETDLDAPIESEI